RLRDGLDVVAPDRGQSAQAERLGRWPERNKVGVKEHRIDLAAPCLYLTARYISDTFQISAQRAQRLRPGGCAPDHEWPVNSSTTCKACRRPIRETARSWTMCICLSIPTPRSACWASTAPANRRFCASWPE